MFQFRSAFSAENYCNNIETKGTIFNIIGGEKIPSGSEQSLSLGVRNRRFGRPKRFIGPGPHLDECDGPIRGDHNEVDFTGFAGEIAGERFQTFFLEEALGAFFAPSAEAFWVG
jgi:hypothetical protein